MVGELVEQQNMRQRHVMHTLFYKYATSLRLLFFQDAPLYMVAVINKLLQGFEKLLAVNSSYFSRVAYFGGIIVNVGGGKFLYYF